MELSVNPSELKKSATGLKSIHGQLKSAATMVQQVQKSLDTSMESYEIVSRKLQDSSRSLIKISTKTSKMQTGIAQIADQYIKVENDLSGRRPTATKATYSSASAGASVGINVLKANNAAKKINVGVAKASKTSKSIWSKLKSNPYVQAGLAFMKIIGAITAMLAAWASVLGSSGGSIPLAVIATVYGVDTIINAWNDLKDIKNGNMDHVGKNQKLNNMMKGAGRDLGNLLGCPESGTKFGDIVYDILGLTTTVNKLSTLSTKGITGLYSMVKFVKSGIESTYKVIKKVTSVISKLGLLPA